MNHRSWNFIRNNVAVFIFLLFFCFASTVLAAPTRVAILPFDVNAEKDLTFLQEGIVDMLASRIEWGDRVEVINKSETEAALAQAGNFDGESRALLVGGKLKADYVLFGSITVFGESVSIDAKMVDVSGQQPSMPFFAQTSSMGGVIPQINQFATNINQTVFGRGDMQRPSMQPAVQPGAAAVPAPQGQPATQGYNPRMHPEKLLKSGVQEESQVPVQPYQTPNPAFINTAPDYPNTGSTESFWKSQRFDAVITGIDIGDVDKDGRIETVILEAGAVLIYRSSNNRLSRVAEIEKIRTDQYIGVDIGDINGNGYPEIFISGLNAQKNRYSSFILEYDGSQYNKIAGSQPWLFRVIKSDHDGYVLIGQKQPPAGGDLYTQPIYKMNWDGIKYTPADQFLPGNKANILSVTTARVIDPNQSNVVGYNQNDRVVVFRPGGDIEWKSTDAHGGSLSFYQMIGSEGPTETDTHFFPMRLLAADMDNNGTDELIVASNKEIANRLVKNQRVYSNSYFSSLSWQGLGMSQNWKTNEIDGRVSDYVIGDFDNDGSNELVGAVVRKEGRSVFGKTESIVVAYELGKK